MPDCPNILAVEDHLRAQRGGLDKVRTVPCFFSCL